MPSWARIADSPRRRGAAATEFALTLPLLGLLTLAVVDFGRMPFSYIALSNAARVGAERGATQGFTDYTRTHWEAEVRAAVEEEIGAVAGFDADRLNVVIDAESEGNDVWRINVTAEYPFETLVEWPGLPHLVTMQRSVSMRQVR